MIPRLPSELQKKWLASCAPLIGENHLDVADLNVSATLAAEPLARYWLPLAEAVRPSTSQRRMIGIVGEPGAGKSVLALLLSQILERRPDDHRSLEVAAFSIDGFHYPNDFLDKVQRRQDDGASVSLRKIKGTPWTYDVESLLKAIKQLAGAEKAVNLPAYSRQLHEPRPNAITVKPSVGLVLIEGNWLLYKEPPWDRVIPHLDLSIYIAAPPRVIRRSLISRHLAGRKTWQQTRDIYRAADRPNRIRVRDTMDSADLRITMDEKRNIIELEDRRRL